jgi:probable HAF family extracellular repeat protein
MTGQRDLLRSCCSPPSLTAAAVTALALLVSPPASADLVYDFRGQCSSGCTGSAVGTLTLADSYVPGAKVTSADFVSFTYTSSTGSFSLDAASLDRMDEGALPTLAGASLQWIEIDAIDDDTGLNACSEAGIPDDHYCPSEGFWSLEWASAGIARDAGPAHSWTLRDPHFRFKQLGFTGAGYESNNGYSFSGPVFLTDTGEVVGSSERYDTSGAHNGSDAWLQTGTSTLQIGLIGPGYEGANGRRASGFYGMNDVGLVTGSSDRFDTAGNPRGYDAWLYEGGATVRLGLTGPGYESAAGFRTSELGAWEPNSQGQVAGYSGLFDASGNRLGEDAWLYTDGASVRIGPSGPEYEQPGGGRRSNPRYLNDAGQVVGFSDSAGYGRHAWLYDGTTTIQLGFTGPGYERADGYRASDTGTDREDRSTLNAAGQVAGYSARFDASGHDHGTDAWLYDGASTVQLGFTGLGYEQADGYRQSYVFDTNEAGQVAGHSARFSGTISFGQDAWLDDAEHIVRLGLLGAGYEQTDGFRWSEVQALNDAGQVAGYSNRYDGSNEFRGTDAWLSTGGISVAIGLTGPGYEQSDGHREGSVHFVNDIGQVAGYSTRYDASNRPDGRDAWVYDPVGNHTYAINLSTRPSDGYAWSHIDYLDDRGFALGMFELYDQATSAALGRRAFYFFSC